MSVFAKASASRSRRIVVGGIALIGATVLALSACATPTPEGGETAGPIEDYTLKIGTLLPQTGNLAFLGPPEEAGVLIAAAEVNEASADTGVTVEITLGDSGNTDNKAYETEAPRVLAEGVSAIIGAASSGTSLQFIDQVIGEGVIQFSPANTSDAFTTYDDNGLYFRTAPSDVLQGEVLGNLIAEDGNETLGMIVLNDSYGTGLAKYVTEAFEAAGGEVVAAPTYNTGDTNFTTQISEVLAAAPDAIALITFDEVTTILPGLLGQFPADKLYFVDGNLTNFGAEEFPAGSLTGAKGTLPGLTIDTLGDFTGQLDEFVAARASRPSRTTATQLSRTTRSSCSRSRRWLPAVPPSVPTSPRSCRRSPAAPAMVRSARRSRTAQPSSSVAASPTTTASPVRSRSTRSATRPRRPSASTSTVRTTPTSRTEHVSQTR